MPVDFKLYLITDRRAVKLPLSDAVRCALKGGVRAVQLREKDLPIRSLLDLALELRSITKEYGARLFINDRVDIAVAVDADGVHLGHQSMPPEAVRKIAGNTLLVGVSTHNEQEAREAERGGADFITFGPVYSTPSKVGLVDPVGCGAVKKVTNSVAIPVFGLGGITSGNADDVLRSGAYGIAMISAILRAGDIQKAAEEMVSHVARGGA